MKKIFILLVILFAVMKSYSQNVTIVESQSISGHVMDTVWRYVATGMGMNATIVPQATLNDTLFFPTSDILIVSSGVIMLSALQISTITQYMQSGRNLYIQAEYDCATYNTNGTFEMLANTYGGTFSWNGTISGILAPMNVLGTLSNTANIVSPLSYFWYGCRGNACNNVEPYLEYGGDYFGFIFTPPDTSYGIVITNSDQDWVRVATSIPLMQNILTVLSANAYQCNPLYVLANLGNDTTICPGSTLVLNSGSTGYTYLWSTGATSDSISITNAGTYWVSVNNGTCSASDTIIVTSNCSTPVVALNSSDTSFCEKQCINFHDLSTNSPNSWQWSFPGGSPSSSTLQNPDSICYNTYGSFDVQLIACNSFGCDTLLIPGMITEYQTPTAPIITKKGDTLFSSHAFSYAWYNANNLSNVLSTDSFLVTTISGTYFVIAIDSNGCSVGSAPVTVGIDENNFADGIIVSPNPSSGNFIISLRFTVYGLRLGLSVCDLLGHEIYKSQITKQKTEIDLSKAADGIYFLKIVSEKNIFSKKIIVQH